MTFLFCIQLCIDVLHRGGTHLTAACVVLLRGLEIVCSSWCLNLRAVSELLRAVSELPDTS